MTHSGCMCFATVDAARVTLYPASQADTPRAVSLSQLGVGRGVRPPQAGSPMALCASVSLLVTGRWGEGQELV